MVLRLSETSNLHEDSEGLMPSLALKFLMDGTDSENIVAMPSFLNSGSWNFFEKPMSNRVDPFDQDENWCEAATIQRKLGETTAWPFDTGISQIADRLPNGGVIEKENVKTPYQLIFDSPLKDNYSSTKPLDASGNQIQWYEQMRDIPSGSTIFNVFAMD